MLHNNPYSKQKADKKEVPQKVPLEKTHFCSFIIMFLRTFVCKSSIDDNKAQSAFGIL